jgi:F-type H+-transporting ATPase subunit delta
MGPGAISVRYARALISLATEQSLVEEVYSDLKTLNDVFYKDKSFLALLTTPALSIKEKKRIVKETFEGRLNALTMNFLYCVIEKRREEFLGRMFIKFVELYQEMQNIVPVKVVSAFDLTAKHVKEIETTVKDQLNKHPNVELETNPKLIGGYILTIKDMQIDMSLRTALNKFNRISK